MKFYLAALAGVFTSMAVLGSLFLAVGAAARRLGVPDIAPNDIGHFLATMACAALAGALWRASSDV